MITRERLTLGQQLRAAREAKGLSVAAMDILLEGGKGYTVNNETGVGIPTAAALREIAAALSLPPHTFALAHFRSQWGDLADLALDTGAWRETAKELPPDPDETVLVWVVDGTVDFARNANGGWEFGGAIMEHDFCSHWMPLPAAPPAADPTGTSE